MSATLASTLARAANYAQAQQHIEVTLEHLLLALTEDDDACVVMTSTGVNLDQLKTDVSGHVGRIEHRLPADHPGTAAISEELRRILNAAAAAASGRRNDINGGIVLAAIIGDGQSSAAALLQAHGLTFGAAIEVVKRRFGPEADATRQARPIPAPHPVAAPREPEAGHHTDANSILAEARSRLENRRAATPPSPHEVHHSVAPPLSAPAPGPTASPTPSQFPSQAPSSLAPAPSSRPAPAQQPAPAPAPSFAAPIPEPATPMAPTAPPAAQPSAPPGPPRETPARTREPVQSSPARGVDIPSAPGWAPPPSHPQPPQPPPHRAPPPLNPDVGLRPPPPTGPFRVDAPPAPAGARSGPGPRQPAPPPGSGSQAPGPSSQHGSQRAHHPSAPTQTGSAPGQKRAPLPAIEEVFGTTTGAIDRDRHGTAARPPTSEATGTPAPSTPPVQTRTTPSSAPPRGGRDTASTRKRRRSRSSEMQTGQLIENIPRSMRVALPSLVEARIAKSEVKHLADGIADDGAAYRHDVITRAMSVRLRAPDGGFFIETASPETQWIENALGLMADDYASWRWTVTPKARGSRRLQLIISARTVGADGLAAETALPDQVVEIKVRTNYARLLVIILGWSTAAVAGAVLASFGGEIWGGLSSFFSALSGP